MKRVEPIAERECHKRISRVSCDFKIVLDNRKGLASNAYQTLDRSGRTVIAFTRVLIGEARNQHELAFIMGHDCPSSYKVGHMSV